MALRCSIVRASMQILPASDVVVSTAQVTTIIQSHIDNKVKRNSRDPGKTHKPNPRVSQCFCIWHWDSQHGGCCLRAKMCIFLCLGFCLMSIQTGCLTGVRIQYINTITTGSTWQGSCICFAVATRHSLPLYLIRLLLED